jgi:hypothetical protein
VRSQLLYGVDTFTNSSCVQWVKRVGGILYLFESPEAESDFLFVCRLKTYESKVLHSLGMLRRGMHGMKVGVISNVFVKIAAPSLVIISPSDKK